MKVKSTIAFLLALYLRLSFFLSISSPYFPAFTWRVAAAVSKGGRKLIEPIEAKRKLTAIGWLVLLFCLETNAATSLLERGGFLPLGPFPTVLRFYVYAASIAQHFFNCCANQMSELLIQHSIGNIWILVNHTRQFDISSGEGKGRKKADRKLNRACLTRK